MLYVTVRITFETHTFGNVERNSHCDVLHITPSRVARLVLDCNGVFAIKAYGHVRRRREVHYVGRGRRKWKFKTGGRDEGLREYGWIGEGWYQREGTVWRGSV